MKIGAPTEVATDEARVALTPASAAKIQKLGHSCLIQSGAGKAAGFNDDTYRAAGVEVVADAAALWKAADVIVKVRPPENSEVALLDESKTLISFSILHKTMRC